MARWLPYWLPYTLVGWLACGLAWGGAWSIAAVAYILIAVPIIDAVAGLNTHNPAQEQSPSARAGWIDLPLRLWAPTQLFMIVAVIWRAREGSFSPWEVAGLVASLGIVNGAAGITIAHELMHRRRLLDRALAELLMTSVSYTHFCVEHVHGHHRHVSTPQDPASSRFGESFYRFYFRVLPGSLVGAWRIEGARMDRKASGQRRWLADRRVRYLLCWTLTLIGIGVWAGAMGLGIFFVQSWLAFSLLEIINYVEHYGLRRRELSPGKFERVRPEHSWNSSHRFSNWYLFNLARHSDHHYLASRPFDELRHHDDVPQMPAGYASMLLMALVPPLWFRVMNPRVQAWRPSAAQPRPEQATGSPA